MTNSQALGFAVEARRAYDRGDVVLGDVAMRNLREARADQINWALAGAGDAAREQVKREVRAQVEAAL